MKKQSFEEKMKRLEEILKGFSYLEGRGGETERQTVVVR